ncbi:MAG: LemA family protein [Acidimicrobiales bacterium]
MSPLVVTLVVAGIVASSAIISFNRFISQRNLITNSWSNVETELRRRYDLIPNLVETVGGYAAHEKSTLTEVIEARAGAVAQDGDAAEQAQAENILVEGLRHLLAVSEAYPELVASEHFLVLQRELVTTEDRIQAARRLFNGNVRDYNRRIEAIPSRFVAAVGRFRKADYFEVEPAVREARRPNSTSTF